MRYVISLSAFLLGFVLIWKTYRLSLIMGTIPWAERNLGGGGTYILLKIVGLLFIVFAFGYAFGVLEILIFPLRNLFGG
ncbi:MAG: hypothetical protein A2846_02200 [Candidatus Doudnabacteria bacterium RIFCSPHIGHO2_01_FULL_49_9]|uniref:Uncharacterized protein n=1 Tax=Candidatus Doudnabacteria bacterium RIFCSPHIGHO2_01_FULL_49_9 TaxID=1817827 RepID=A0A1F5NZ72_9BACT|nr:MAG: hypothetical protein A2846_02200 [Candidatus Doudnabacteria bacterium RIFCSPHIGHO2_01_FULL_49_9]